MKLLSIALVVALGLLVAVPSDCRRQPRPASEQQLAIFVPRNIGTEKKPECKTRKKCTKRGGLCGRYTNESDCRGTLLSTGIGCKGRKCQCCIPDADRCPAGFTQHGNNYCFYFEYTKIRVNQTQALAQCSALGGGATLPYPSGTDLSTWWDAVAEAKVVWLFWMGATWEDDRWVWLDGTTVPSKAWVNGNAGEPNWGPCTVMAADLKYLLEVACVHPLPLFCQVALN